MKKIILSFILFLGLFFNSAFASTWVQIDDYSFIDKDSIKYYVNSYGHADYNKKIFWSKDIQRISTYDAIEKESGKKYHIV